MNYQPPVHPAFHTVDRQEMSTTLNLCPSRQSSPPALPLQQGSIDMSIDPIPLFPAFIGNDDSASTLQSDAADQEPHPLLTNNNGSSRKMDDIDNDGDGRAAFSAAATDIGASGGNVAKGHKRGDTFEPLPFRTSEDDAGIDNMTTNGCAPQRDNDGVGYWQPYAGQQIQMQVYPAYHQEPKKFDSTSPARMQPPIVSHAHTEDQMHTDHSNKGHRKVPSFVTPLRGYDDAMIEEGNVAPRHHAYGYHHNYHGHHGYYPPYHLWQHQYGGAGHSHHQQPPIPHPQPAPPIFHPLANDTGIPTSKYTIKRRYFQENRHGGAFTTPVPAPIVAPAYHRPPLPSHGPVHHYNEQDSGNHHGKAAHRRGPSIIFDNDEDWHQQSPTVLYRSRSTGDSSTTTATANVRDESDVRLRAPKKRSKKKPVTKKKRKSKSTFTNLSDDDMPPLPTLMSNNDNIGIDEVDSSKIDDNVMVSDLDMDLPLESLVNFQKKMNSSERTQKALEKWDKKMGLKRSHSKTMWDSDRSRQKLQNAVLGIQRAKLRLMRASTPPTNRMLENAVANKVDVTESSYQSPTFEIRTPPAQTDAITTLSAAKQNSKGAESSSDSSILSESRDASNQSFVVLSPQKIVDDEDQPVGAFILGCSPATGANHTKMASASDILPLSPAQPSPPRANLAPKWVFKEV